ncbi:class A sortase [Levilactobacillus acidifarinae]|uniref:Sortase (Surface protein transpeptidase) n=1 Tax=Levilactobacillus acidifarinae DSM 19394 = JCM 15949 TaxID=1423715 RepID=A0A0R1LU02_9LACO|nr:class A sortase [Levilactobacillus acidifarinae]KRK96313.1 hypothetical protein FD25_GL001800 [Levilactobacillus acidifarinae DSM 19394]GEO69108.1 class A sortase [Levilactobacillus acidifarinae]
MGTQAPQKRKNGWSRQFWGWLGILLLIGGGLTAIVYRDQIAPQVDAGILRTFDKPQKYQAEPKTIHQNTQKDRPGAISDHKWRQQQGAVRSISALDYLRRPKLSAHLILGSVAVPSLQMSLPILKGATSRNLQIGAGTLKQGERMGTGNYAMAAHNMDQPGYMFSNLPRIKEGAKIYLTDLDQVYVYRAQTHRDRQAPWHSYYYHRQVRPSNVQTIQDIPRTPIVTLVTCNATGSAREVVQGKYLHHYAYATASANIRRSFDVSTVTRTTIV